jgi:hypothetical protein
MLHETDEFIALVDMIFDMKAARLGSEYRAWCNKECRRLARECAEVMGVPYDIVCEQAMELYRGAEF